MAQSHGDPKSLRLVLGVTLVLMLLIPAPGSAGAANVGGNTPMFGTNLYSNPITANGDYLPIVTFCRGYIDIIWYGAGSAPDARWLNVDATSHTDTPMSISGWYQPLVGDFDGDDCEDIFWYGPGLLPDYVWYVNPDRSIESHATRVNGEYLPVVGNFDPALDPFDEIYWYGPGSTTETMWAPAGPRGLFDSLPAPQVNGTYQPLRFLESYVLWYAPGIAQDYVTAPTAGSTSLTANFRTSVNGTYEPFQAGKQPVLYSPGPGDDYYVSGMMFSGTDRVILGTVQGAINGTYRAGVAGHWGANVLHAPGPGQDYLLTPVKL